jgi:hypothetical protein
MTSHESQKFGAPWNISKTSSTSETGLDYSIYLLECCSSPGLFPIQSLVSTMAGVESKFVVNSEYVP